MMSFSFDSAFWVFNMVSNYVYSRYRIIYPVVLDNIHRIENRHMTLATAMELKIQMMIGNGQVEQARKELTSFSVGLYQELVGTWLQFFQYLFVTFMDGNVKMASGNPKNPIVKQPGYGQAWYDRIANETGTRYQYPSTKQAQRLVNSPRRKL